MTAPQKICAPHELKAKLLELLRDGPSASDDLARFTGYSGNSVRERLADLRVDGYVFRKSGARPTGGMHYIWSLNPDAGQLPPQRPTGREPTGFGKPRQVTLQRYPMHNHRDTLASAFFGPARKEAA
jgi:hypothetical protein